MLGVGAWNRQPKLVLKCCFETSVQTSTKGKEHSTPTAMTKTSGYECRYMERRSIMKDRNIEISYITTATVQNIYSYKTVGRACSQNGEISCTKQSPATNISHQEKGGKIQEKMGRGSDRRCCRVAWHMALEN